MVICSVVWRDKFFSPKTADLFLLQKRLDIATAVSKSVFDGIIFGVRKARWDETSVSSGPVKMLAAICKAHGFGEGEIELASLLKLKQRVVNSIASGGDLPRLRSVGVSLCYLGSRC